MLKKTILTLAVAVSIAGVSIANAGPLKKLAIGTGVIAGGVVAYKIAKKLNVGGVTENLANYIDNAPKTLNENPSFIPTVKADLSEILNNPEATPEDLKKFVALDDLMRESYGGGTVITEPSRQLVIDQIRKGDVDVKEPVVISGGTLISNDEQKLAENMNKAGLGTTPNGYKAFHIVSPTDVNFTEARKILSSVGIDINQSDNGVYLPTGKTKGDEVHTSKLNGNKDYAKYVNRLVLENSNSKQGVVNILGDIFLKLSSGDANFK